MLRGHLPRSGDGLLRARLQNQIAAEKSRSESELHLLQAKNQKEVLAQQLQIDKLEAQRKVIQAEAAAKERSLLAGAKANENRAEAAAHTALTVQAAGYEALGKLGGSGTTIFLGDWSRAPTFLWPRQYLTPPPGQPMAPASTKPAKLELDPSGSPPSKAPAKAPRQTTASTTGGSVRGAF
jgi:hypothetical protein